MIINNFYNKKCYVSFIYTYFILFQILITRPYIAQNNYTENDF